MSNYLRDLRRFVGGVGVAMLLLLVTFVSFPDGEAQANSIISQIGLDIDGEAAGDESGLSMAMSADGSRVAIGALFNDGTGLNAGHVRVYTLTNNGWTQTGGDIDGEAAGDWSGYPVAMSADGSRVAIGAIYNDNVNGSDSGHVRVYTLTNNGWTQTGGDIDGEAAGDWSGRSVAMSADGSRVAIGANSNDNVNGSDSGHVRVYTLTGNTWTQTGGDIDGEAASDFSGWSVAMSADGSRVAIGAIYNDGTGSNAGHVRVYTLTNNMWTQTGGDINGEAAGDMFGYTVAMSADGSRVAIGANNNDGNGSNAGHVRVYTLTNNGWTQTGGDIDGEAAGDLSGWSVAMSADGSRVAISARLNDGVKGSDSGHVRLYTLTNNAWTQTGGDIDGEAAGDQSGYSVAMSADGSRVAIGANKNDGTGSDSGHVRVYQDGSAPTTTTTTTTIAPTTTTTPPEPLLANGTLPELSSGVGQMTKEDGTVIQVPVQQVGQQVQIGTSEFYMALALETGSALYDNSSIILKSDLETIVTGAGFKPGSTVEVWLFSTPILLGTTIVLQDGTFSLPVTVPGNTPAGSHTLQAEGLTTAGVFRAVSAGVIVSKDVVLPETGSQSDGWLIVGMFALIIGTVLVTRRRNLW